MNDGKTLPKRILIVKLSSLGDLFHALPAVHELKTRCGADIDWAVQREYADLARCFTDVNRVIRFPRRGFFRGLGTFLSDLRSVRYDMIVDLQGLLKSALVARAARGGSRIGPSFHREGARLFYNDVATGDSGRHAVERCLDTVRYLGLQPGKPVFPVDFPEVPVSQPAPRVAVLPVSRWPAKNWPLERFAEVIRLVRGREKASFYLLGGNADAAACRRVAEAAGGNDVVNTAGRLSPAETGGLLRRMDLLISNDSGPVHMAAAVGTPVLVLFGPTDPGRTGPYGEGHRVVTSSVECRPCFSRVCRDRGGECMKSISAGEVAAAALDILSANSSRG